MSRAIFEAMLITFASIKNLILLNRTKKRLPELKKINHLSIQWLLEVIKRELQLDEDLRDLFQRHNVDSNLMTSPIQTSQTLEKVKIVLLKASKIKRRGSKLILILEKISLIGKILNSKEKLKNSKIVQLLSNQLKPQRVKIST